MTEIQRRMALPRLPLEGKLYLTYRCNNRCRHCWVRIPLDSPEKKRELTFSEIQWIVEEARRMGCRSWVVSGGEPMFRPDFAEIFDYITRKAVIYSLNTNGTLITPSIARLLKRKGFKMVVLYGATAGVHDHITRNPGSFEAAMRGISYLKEAGARFTVQLIPMRDNYHEFPQMMELARSLSSEWRIGASWLYLSASGDPKRNEEIKEQRLSPKDVVQLDKPDLSFEHSRERDSSVEYAYLRKDDRLFASCIARRRDFDIDPYGQMSFCGFIKDPLLRYDLRKGSFEDCWEKFIPALADTVRGGPEYLDNCGSCELRRYCRWCPVYAYLEHRRFSAKVEYLCAIVKETQKFKRNWQKYHRCHYRIAGITIRVDSDLPIKDTTFHPKFKLFEVGEAGEDVIGIRHHFSLPNLEGRDLGQEVYRKTPWLIYKKGASWIYIVISPKRGDQDIGRVAVFNENYTHVRIYNDGEKSFQEGGLHSLTLFPTDQILLAPVLADRESCYLHSSGLVFQNRGYLFVGHSEAGKSTVVRILQKEAKVLCDDRVIVRRWSEGFRVHGTWSHGEIPEVSSDSAPLKAILFLRKARENYLLPVKDKKEATRLLLACIIRPLATTTWWDKTLSLVERIVCEVPCYFLHFDKHGSLVDVLKGV